MHRIFLLSPAHCGGRRATLLLDVRARFNLASRVHGRTGAPLGEVFAFLSGLYFRGKLAYARTFARPPSRLPGVLVITPNRGLLLPEQTVTIDDLLGFAAVDVRARDARYRVPLARDASRLAARIGRRCEVVLLGSIATDKYVDVLAETFGARLRFPLLFVGRGDMSRGGLMLRCVRENQELEYAPLTRTTHHGPRPPRLLPTPRRPAGG